MGVMILQAIVAILGLVKIFYSNYTSPEQVKARKEKEAIDDDEKLRKECLEMDADAVSARIDKLLSPGDGPAGVQDPSDKTGATSSK